MAIAVERVRRQVQRVQVLPLNQVPEQGRGDEIVFRNGQGHTKGETGLEEGGKVGRENLSSRVHPRSAR